MRFYKGFNKVLIRFQYVFIIRADPLIGSGVDIAPPKVGNGRPHHTSQWAQPTLPQGSREGERDPGGPKLVPNQWVS